MKRCRSTENADDVRRTDGTEKNPEMAADQNVELEDKDPKGQCICNHNAGGDDSDNNGVGHVVGFAEEDTVENSSTGFPEDDEEDNEEDEYENDDKDESEDLVDGLTVEEMQRNIASFICSQEVTPQILEDENFQEMMTNVKPSLDFNAIKHECLLYYEDAKGKVKDFLNNMDRRIALSVDVFTHYEYFGPSYDFLCITAHFIDDNWKLKKWVLRFQEHNTMESDFINIAILKSLREWNILDKVANITSRNAHDEFFVSEVLGTIKDQINGNRRLPLDSSLFPIPCVAEMFSLMAQDAFNSIDETIDKIRELHWSKSLSMWHITNSKLKNALDMLSLGEFDSEFVRKDYDVPSTDEWDKVKIVHGLVESIYNVAKQMFETKHPSSNKFLYNLQELRAILVKESTNEDSFTSNLAKKMLQRLEKYLKDSFLLLAIASVMDPRLKMHYIEYMSSEFHDTNGSFRSGPVLEAIRSLYAEYSNRDIKQENLGGPSDPKTEDGNPNSDWFHQFSQFVQINNQSEKSDLELYLEEPVCRWSDDFNTLQWWRSEGPKYPIVAKMARDILSMPLSVATSYDAYWYLENRHADERVLGLGAELMNATMCCWSWSPRTISELDLLLLASCGASIF